MRRKILNSSHKPVFFLTLFVLTLFAQSCVTYNKCLEKFGVVGDSVKRSFDLPIDLKKVVEADSVEHGINIDSLCESWRLQATGLSLQAASDSAEIATTVVVSKSQKLKVAYWIDQYNRLLKIKAIKIRDTIRIRDTVRAEVNCPPCIVVDPYKSLQWYSPKLLWKQFQFFAAWLVLVGFSFLLVRSFLDKHL